MKQCAILKAYCMIAFNASAAIDPALAPLTSVGRILSPLGCRPLIRKPIHKYYSGSSLELKITLYKASIKAASCPKFAPPE